MRALVIVVALVLAVVISSAYVRAMLAPSSLPLPMKTVEWVRDNGGAGLVSLAERVFYTATAPKPGGPGLRTLPAVGATRASSHGPVPGTLTSATVVRAPVRVIGAVSPMLSGEGIWRGTGRATPGGSPVQLTVFRPEAAYPRQLAYAAWIDTSRVHLRLYPGRTQPPDATARGPMEVPPSLRTGLLATFNSGFTYKDCRGGFAVAGSTIEPMRNGQATVVGYADGRVDVVSWTGGARVGSGVAFARQNLPLIVDAGNPSPKLADGTSWGVTVGNAVRVWRSALGVDAQGDLIYLAAPGQTAASLAGAMIRAGAVRAMQLDINTFWPTFITYEHPGAGGAAKLVPNPDQTAARYLTPDDRDFFAVYAGAAVGTGGG